MITSAQVVETSVTTTDNIPSRDYTHQNDQEWLKRNLYVTGVYVLRVRFNNIWE